MKRFLILSLTFFVSLATYAQQQAEPCLTDYLTQQIYNNNPALAEQQKEQFFSLYQQRLQNVGIVKKSGTKRIIPVVFHVIHTYGPENISREQIVDQIRVLNEDFSRTNADKTNTRSIFEGDAAECDVEFRLATIDPSGNCTDGVTRTYSELTSETRDEVKTLIRWDNTKYLNVWVVKSIRSQNSDQPGTTTLGFAYLPYSLPNTANLDGIVICSDFVGTIGTSSPAKGGRTLTHEVGHYLGLLHPFSDGNSTGCGGSDCSSTGDRVCDTPPVAAPSFHCPIGANTCHNDNPDRLDQIENFMDYADGSCQNMFTWGQKTLIDVVLSGASYRQKLVSAANLIATGTNTITTANCKPVADFSSVAQTICSGNTVTFNDLSWNGKVTSRTWTLNGGSPATSSDSSVTVTFNTPGTYDITLQVSNSQGQTQVTRSKVLVVMNAVSANKAPTYEGFEGSTFPPQDWAMTSNVTTKNWERTTVASATGSASARVLINTTNATDEVYGITLPSVDLTATGATAYMNFKVAYALRTGVTSDRLRVLYSTDCGNNWTLLKQYVGSLLTSSSDYVGASFVPASSGDWKFISLPLNSITATKRQNVMFRFEAYSNGGNNIYLDDINLSATQDPTNAVTMPTKADMELTIQPNPAVQTATLQFTLAQQANVQVQVYDVTGRLVQDFGSAAVQPGLQTYQISKLDNNLTNGIYFVKLLVNNVLYTERLVFVQ
jgi:PKD repeat protein